MISARPKGVPGEVTKRVNVADKGCELMQREIRTEVKMLSQLWNAYYFHHRPFLLPNAQTHPTSSPIKFSSPDQ